MAGPPVPPSAAAAPTLLAPSDLMAPEGQQVRVCVCARVHVCMVICVCVCVCMCGRSCLRVCLYGRVCARGATWLFVNVWYVRLHLGCTIRMRTRVLGSAAAVASHISFSGFFCWSDLSLSVSLFSL